VRTFRVMIDGEQYEVSVEEIGVAGDGSRSRRSTGGGSIQIQPAPVPRAAAQLVVPGRPAAAPKPQSLAAAGGGERSARHSADRSDDANNVVAPLPGVVLDILVEKGQTVAEGEVVAVLEAMKMENEITSPRAGRIADIRVRKGDSVNMDDILAVLE